MNGDLGGVSGLVVVVVVCVACIGVQGDGVGSPYSIYEGYVELGRR